MEYLETYHYIIIYLVIGLLLTMYHDFVDKNRNLPGIYYLFGMIYNPWHYFQKLFRIPGKIFYYFKYRKINKKTP